MHPKHDAHPKQLSQYITSFAGHASQQNMQRNVPKPPEWIS